MRGATCHSRPARSPLQVQASDWVSKSRSSIEMVCSPRAASLWACSRASSVRDTPRTETLTSSPISTSSAKATENTGVPTTSSASSAPTPSVPAHSAESTGSAASSMAPAHSAPPSITPTRNWPSRAISGKACTASIASSRLNRLTGQPRRSSASVERSASSSRRSRRRMSRCQTSASSVCSAAQGRISAGPSASAHSQAATAVSSSSEAVIRGTICSTPRTCCARQGACGSSSGRERLIFGSTASTGSTFIGRKFSSSAREPPRSECSGSVTHRSRPSRRGGHGTGSMIAGKSNAFPPRPP